MGAYLLRRLLLVIPTLWAIITINFFIVQIAPGGPVDQAIATIEFGNNGGMPGGGGEGMGASHARTGVGNISESHYRGGRGLSNRSDSTLYWPAIHWFPDRARLLPRLRRTAGPLQA